MVASYTAGREFVSNSDSTAVVNEQSEHPDSSSSPAGEATSTKLAVSNVGALFRHEAIQAYQRPGVLSSALEVVPLSSRVILAITAQALVVALLIAGFGHVEIISRGRGVVRAEEGVQPLSFQTAGVVREVLVHVGQVVQMGQPIARLDAAALTSAVVEAETQLQSVRVHAEREHSEQEGNYIRDAELLRRRAALTRDRIRNLQSSLALSAREQERIQTLQNEGLTTAQAFNQSSQALAEQARLELSARAELASIEQEQVALDRTHRASATERSQRISQAQARVDAARLLLEQTTVVASRAGRIESLMVTAGEVTAANALVARLVPVSRSDFVTAFIPEQDRAFVSLGSAVQLELDQLPVGEFGSASASVSRVSTEPASVAEVSQVLGAAASPGVYVRIELKLAQDARTERLTALLSSGSLLTVRVALRKRRIIGLVFDPLRSWLD